MNLTRVFSYLFKGSACYYLFRMDDMILMMTGVLLGLGFLLEAVDELRNGNIMNNKGVENERRN